MRIKTAIFFAMLLPQATPALSWDLHQTETSCWISTVPMTSRNAPKSRGIAGVTVTHDLAEQTRHSISIQSGIETLADGEVTFQIDGKQFTALAWQGVAFPRSGEYEMDVLRALRAGNRLTVIWNAGGKNKVTDEYTLAGFTAANVVMERTCPEQ